MNRLNTTRMAVSVLLASSVFAAVMPAQAQPMMGDMGMHRDEGRMHERMTKHAEQRQTELKAKLHLAPSQEAAWNSFVQGTKVPARPVTQSIDREALTKLSAPERMEK